MKKRSFSKTLDLLCRTQPTLLKNGALNSAAIGRAVKIEQATIYRMLKSQQQEPAPDNAEKLCAYFNVSREQLVGSAPIPALDKEESDALSRLAESFRKAAALQGAEQEFFLQMVEGLLLRSKPRKDPQDK